MFRLGSRFFFFRGFLPSLFLSFAPPTEAKTSVVDTFTALGGGSGEMNPYLDVPGSGS